MVVTRKRSRSASGTRPGRSKTPSPRKRENKKKRKKNIMEGRRTSSRTNPEPKIIAKSIADTDPLESFRDRQYYIFTHNLTRFYLSPRTGYADNEKWLRNRNIRYVVNVTMNQGDFRAKPLKYKDKLTQAGSTLVTGENLETKVRMLYYQVKVPDNKMEAKKFEGKIESALNWMKDRSSEWKAGKLESHLAIRDELKKPGVLFKNYGILVHCEEGRSRSATLIIAYMMHELGYDLRRAYKLLYSKVPNLNINDGFLNMLRNLEKKWKGIPIEGKSTLPQIPKITTDPERRKIIDEDTKERMEVEREIKLEREGRGGGDGEEMEQELEGEEGGEGRMTFDEIEDIEDIRSIGDIDLLKEMLEDAWYKVKRLEEDQRLLELKLSESTEEGRGNRGTKRKSRASAKIKGIRDSDLADRMRSMQLEDSDEKGEIEEQEYF